MLKLKQCNGEVKEYFNALLLKGQISVLSNNLLEINELNKKQNNFVLMMWVILGKHSVVLQWLLEGLLLSTFNNNRIKKKDFFL